MTEHTHTGEICGGPTIRRVFVPLDWPVGAEVTVTWTEPPEPTGRWVVDEHDGRPYFELADGERTALVGYVRASRGISAEAALVDLIDPHLPPQMPSVDDIYKWLSRNGRVSYPVHYAHQFQAVIRGTLDAIAALGGES